MLFFAGILGFLFLSQKETRPPLEYNAGNTSIAEGEINVTYEVENTGEGNLKISWIWTTDSITRAVYLQTIVLSYATLDSISIKNVAK